MPLSEKHHETKLCALFCQLDTTALDIRKAISEKISNFEDAMMVETVVRSGGGCIVTLNTKDYRRVPDSMYSPPAQFVGDLLTQ